MAFHLKAILQSQRKSWTAHKRLFFVNLWFASCGCWCISLLQCCCRRGEHKTKEHFQLGLGEWVRLPSFSSLSASRSASHLCVVSFYTLALWSSAPGMPSLFLENSSGSSQHPIRGSNRFSITVLKCSVISLHLKTQSENHTVKKNIQGANITVAKQFWHEFFRRALLSTICFLWIGLTGEGVGAVPCHGPRSSLSVNDTWCNGVAASLSQQLCPGGTLAASLVQGALEATSASLRWHQTGSFCLLHNITFAETEGHER